MQKFKTSTRKDAKRKRFNSSFSVIALLLASLAVVVLITLLSSISYRALVSENGPALNAAFLGQSYVENSPSESGVRQAIIGSFALCLICAIVAMPIGIGTAIYMEEFRPRGKVARFFHSLVQLNINNLAGVPSVVYGILGLTAFVYMFSLFSPIQVDSVPDFEMGAEYYYQIKTLGDSRRDIPGKFVTFPCDDPHVQFLKIDKPVQVTDGDGNEFLLNLLALGDPKPKNPELLARSVYAGKSASRARSKKFYHFHLPLSRSILAAGLTLSLVILPIIIIASQEAIRAVPTSLREASYGIGANKWETVRSIVLPSATPGIMTGAILAMSRAIGEAAPILVVMGSVKGMTGGFTSLTDRLDTLPVTIFSWAKHSDNQFEHLSAAAIIVLLLFLLAMNSFAILIRYRAEKRNKGG